MKDINQKDITIGDKVVYIRRSRNSAYLTTGVVTGFSPKMVRIEYTTNFGIGNAVESSSYAPYNLAITDKAP